MPERQAEIKNARVAQLVERDLAKVEAAGSSPVSRFFCVPEAAAFSICCMQYFSSYYFKNCVFFAILLRIREK